MGGLMEKDFYTNLNQKLVALIGDETDWLANLANATALLYWDLEKINWAGFYLMKTKNKIQELVLGPFQGKPACIRIPIGKGVCGTAISRKCTIVVDDVHQFPGHIVCDQNSASEIVVPIIVNNTVRGVLDIDSPYKARFNCVDQHGLEEFANQLQFSINWDDVPN